MSLMRKMELLDLVILVAVRPSDRRLSDTRTSSSALASAGKAMRSCHDVGVSSHNCVMTSFLVDV